jgi:adenine-specific DNA-methyltransferase
VNLEEIKAELKRLIEKRRTIDESTSEANIEATLISQLFTLLDWNFLDPSVYDRNSYVRGAGYPDVALKIDNEPVIFVEVKKIGKIPKNRIDPQAQMTLPLKELADLIDRTPEEKQAFKYARGEQVDWAILTNFDCLFVYDADKEELVLSFKTPEEYLQRFDELLWLSREKVKEGSLKWAQSQLKKEEIDRSFLEKLKNWRVALAQNIYEENSDNHILKDDKGKFDLDKLMAIVQRVLSRLMIIQIADDREVLKKHNLLENLIKTYENLGDYVTKDHLLKKFIDLSEMMDQHHNTSIFTPGHPCDEVFISNGVLNKTIKELCHKSFRKMTADILGATYESYLGYRFSLKNGKIEAEVDQRVRKQAGIYYTPSYIVRYIVDNTLGVKLKELEDQYGLEAGEKAKGLKILDPACGSGSFLIYAFDVLANFYERINEKIKNEQVRLTIERGNPDIFEMRERLKNLPPTVSNYPKRILEDHLYGVDLDPAACEIATINLVIKAFEKIKDKKLPLILNQNVKVGNSLISGVEKKEDLEKIKDEIERHIELRRGLKEAEDDEEKRQLMKEIDQLRQKVNLQLNEPLKKYFDQPEEKRPFNWEFEFPEVFDSEKPEEQKGFDVVIGNPPWIESKRMPLEDKSFFEENFHSMQKQYDIFNAFVEKGVHNLKVGGALSYIVPSRFLMNPDYEKFREFLIKRTKINQIVDVGEHIFKDVEMPALILVSTKDGTEEKCSANVVTVRSNILDFERCNWNEYLIPQNRFFYEDKYLLTIYLPEKSILQEIIRKAEKNANQLSNLVHNARGVEIGKKSKAILDQPVCKKYVRFLVGEDIDRYQISSQRFLKLGLRDVDYKTPALYKGEKILIRKTGTGIRATYDNSGLYVIQVIYILKLKEGNQVNIKYILGLLNSKFLSFYYFSKFGEKTKKAFPHLRQENVLSLPIPCIDFAVRSAKLVHDQLVKHVDIMLERNKQKNELLKIFEQVLKNHTHEFQPFGKAYYEKPEYIEKIDKKAEAIASSTDDLSKIFLEEKGNALVFSVQIKGEKHEALRLKIADKDFRLFLFYSVRKYLEENKRRKKWTTKSLPKVLDVILGRLEVSVFKTKAKVYDPNYNLKMIDLVMKEFKTKFHKEFPKGNLHLSQIEEEIQDTDNSIDALVFKLYELNKDEVTTVLDSMETPETVKKDILKKFEALK